jgi:RimJ/RimL family protein N-acetyltransferase
VSEVREPTVETRRLLLRMFSNEDFDDYARITSDPEVMRYVGGKALSRDEAWRSLGYLLGHWKIRGFGLWAAEEKATGALVGRIGLYQPEGWPGLEVGWLVDRVRWGEGFRASRAGRGDRSLHLQRGTRRMDRPGGGVPEPAPGLTRPSGPG